MDPLIFFLMVLLVFFLFSGGANSQFLVLLLGLEMVGLGLFLGLSMVFSLGYIFYILFYLVFMVGEGVMGLSILSVMSRSEGLYFFSYLFFN